MKFKLLSKSEESIAQQIVDLLSVMVFSSIIYNVHLIKNGINRIIL